MNYFEQFIFNEASSDNQLNKLNNKKSNNSTITNKNIKPLSPPPDFTNDDNINKNDEQNKENTNNQDIEEPNDNEFEQEPGMENTDELQGPGEEENLDSEDIGGDEELDPNAEETGEDPSLTGGEDGIESQEQTPDNDSEIFGSLTPEQIEIKKTELKTQFKNLYDAINSSLDSLDNISRTTEDSVLISFVIKKLLELRMLTNDSLIKSFKLRSYIENQIELRKLIASYEMILKIISDINDYRIKLRNSNEKMNKKQKRNIHLGFTQNLNRN